MTFFESDCKFLSLFDISILKEFLLTMRSFDEFIARRFLLYYLYFKIRFDVERRGMKVFLFKYGYTMVANVLSTNEMGLI